MNVNDLDLFFSLPITGYGQWFNACNFPFTISLKFNSSKYMRIMFLDKSNGRWCVCDKNHVYHIINPEKVSQVLFIDYKNQKKINSKDLLKLLKEFKIHGKMEIKYSFPKDIENSKYADVLVDGRPDYRFERHLKTFEFSQFIEFLKAHSV